MPKISGHNATILAIVLAAVMCATRGHHFATSAYLPDASWPIFFLLGFYFRNRLVLPLFLALAALIDCFAVTQLGVSNYCMTPAYPFLIPAYSALWFAGRWYAARHQPEFHTLPKFLIAAVAGTAACELISSGSFYFLGGRFTETSLVEFNHRLIQYFPPDLGSTALYLGIAALVHVGISTIHRPSVTT